MTPTNAHIPNSSLPTCLMIKGVINIVMGIVSNVRAKLKIEFFAILDPTSELKPCSKS